MVSYEVSIGFVIITVLLCAGSLNMTEIVNAQRSGVGTRVGAYTGICARLVLAGAVSDVRRVLYFRSCRDESAAVRPAGGGIGTGRRLYGRIFIDTPYLLFMLGRVCGDHDHVCA